MGPFALVTARITITDLIEPPVRVGPVDKLFLQPPLGPISFRGRDRDLTVDMLRDAAAIWIGRLVEKDAQVLVGTWTVGMKRGGVREIRGRYAGTFAGRELPVGRDRIIQVELVDFCYPTIGLHSRTHWSWYDGPISLQPALTVSGCG
jgi:hypothetical protein